MNFKPLRLAPSPSTTGAAAAWSALAPAHRRLLSQAYVALAARDAVSRTSALAEFLSEALAGARFENLRALSALRRAVDARDAANARAALAGIRLDDADAQAEAYSIDQILAGLGAGAASQHRRTP